MDILEEFDTAMARARELEGKAKAGRLSKAEDAEVAPLVDRIAELRPQVEKIKADRQLLKELDESGRRLGYGGDGGANPTGGKQFARIDAAFGAKAAAGLAPKLYAPGQKGLVAGGSVVTPIALDSRPPLELPGAVPDVLAAIPTVVRESPTYAYLRQTVKDLGASVVAPGSTKPTSTITVETVQSRLKIIATLSDPVDRFVLDDQSALAGFLQSQLVEAVALALADEVLHGDGTGEHFGGLDHVSGVLTQAFVDADPLVTLAGAISELESLGVKPAVFLLSSADWLAVSTTRNAFGQFDIGGPLDAANRRAWGVPIIVVAALEAGTGWLVGQDSLQLSADTLGVRTDIGVPGDLWTKNQVQLRTEGRWNLDVLRPHGLVKITLTDEES